jgi:cytochrome P450
MARVHAEIEAVTGEEIDERRRTGSAQAARPDCMARFLALEEDALSDEEIVAALRVLVVAGWATTANTLAWVAERLARHPDALARCVADARSTGAQTAGAEGAAGRYLMATVQETLRMRPPVPVTVRYVAADFELGDLRVPKGTLLAADIERMHFREDIYAEPRRFRPERFLETRPGTYTWIPFGGGVHRCIGAGFALTEARLILRTILRRLTFAAEPEHGEPSHRRTLITAPGRHATVTLLPAGS